MKVSELQGAQLDYWAAKANGLDSEISFQEFKESGAHHGYHYYLNDWNHSGPIIERERISIIPIADNDIMAVITTDANKRIEQPVKAIGQTYLEAAMRCYVASVYGDEIYE